MPISFLTGSHKLGRLNRETGRKARYTTEAKWKEQQNESCANVSDFFLHSKFSKKDLNAIENFGPHFYYLHRN